MEFSCVCTFSCEQLCDNCLQRVLKATCIRCAARALRPVSTPRLSSHSSCAIWVNACVRPPPPPSSPPYRGPWEQIVFIRSRNVVLTGRRLTQAPPPAGASRTIPLLSVRFSSSFFLGGGVSFLDHAACLVILYTNKHVGRTFDIPPRAQARALPSLIVILPMTDEQP